MTTNSRTSVEGPASPGGASGHAGTGVEVDRFREALGELVRVIQFRDRDRACCHGVSVSQCHALESLVRSGGHTVNALAGDLYLDKSTTSRIVDGLVDKGLARRDREPSDRRVVRITPTATGVEVHAAITRELAGEYRHLLSGFGPEVRQALPDLLGRLTRSFRARVSVSGGSCCVIPVETAATASGGPGEGDHSIRDTKGEQHADQ